VKDLSVQAGGVPATSGSVSVDSGPRRVALILDGSGNVPNDEWALETEMATSLVSHARPQDRFAFFLVGTNVPASGLLSSDEVQDRLRAVASSRPLVAGSTERIYDALFEAAKRFDPPQFGDALFLFGHPEDSDSAATPEQLEALILKDRLRFYAMSFTDPLRAKLKPGFDLNKPLPKDVMQENADKISHATGYFFSYHSVEALSLRGQSELLKGFLGDLYAGIAEPYRLGISTPSATGRIALQVTVINAMHHGIRSDDVHYPRYVYACEKPASASNQPASK
jgi:hypothetical protein